ncbi:Response regulator protein TodT [Posidoniimonas corsicana]|uniref:Response regulator protein TodT n=1 Tax=Posidoniimonas corsicana TaxID=1938618 RepID=A0A5C5VCS4_9BACT|nr:response regulator [Posidoniimonas corsicana]TWT35659.1 Response regulator protein TodT [Posidoniimonas corsicana]
MYRASQRVVYVAHCDPQVREALAAELRSDTIDARTLPSAGACLEIQRESRPHCLVVGHDLGGTTGLQLQQELKARGDATPLVVLAGQATVAAAVEYMQQGAVTVLEEPYAAETLRRAVGKALDQDAMCMDLRSRLTALKSSASELTAQERRVMDAVIGGKLNKAIANDLDVSVRTVEKIRARVLRKFRAENATQLAAKATELQLLTERTIPLGAVALSECVSPRC